MSNIRIALEKKFEQHRIVIWNDSKTEFQEEFAQLEIPGITKTALADNELGLKIRMLHTEPKAKFLVYRAGETPEPTQNWLLDVELSQGVFQADQASLWLIELGLGQEFYQLSVQHKEFFASKERREALMRLISPTDSLPMVQRKMIAVSTRSGSIEIQLILERLLCEHADKKSDSVSLLARFNLDSLFWDWMASSLEYKSELPSVAELSLLLFKNALKQSLGERGTLHQDALIFLQRFRDSRISADAYKELSAWAAKELGVDKLLDGLVVSVLKEMDWFQCVEEKLLVKLANGLFEKSLPLDTCADIGSMRVHSLWAKNFEHHYGMLQHAEHLQTELNLWKPSMGDALQTVERYCHADFRIDQAYRKMLFHFREAGQPQFLKALCESLDGFYNNRFLLPLSNAWQAHVDAMPNWNIEGIKRQRDFFTDHVQPVLDTGREKIYVVISDALRYEVAEELQRAILKENRYEATLNPVLGVLPSYTQLGMAALLPGKSLSIRDDDTSLTLRDQMPTNGTEYRGKVLAIKSGVSTKAITSKDWMALNREDSRELLKSVSTLYIYHDAIDAVGDDRQTEDRLPNACEEAQKELLQIIKKLANANASNILVTADHGFQYRYTTPEPSDYCSEPAQGSGILCKDRRFVYGHGLQASDAFKKWTSAEIGLEGNLEFLFPKSVLRLRLSGSGSHFVHGGTSLQEVIVPVLAVNIKRVQDVEPVGVEVLRRSEYITSNQVLITVYQTDASSEKQPGRSLRAAFYDTKGELLSDIREFVCDSTAEAPREREQTIKFLLTSRVDQYNHQDIELRLEERIGSTTQYKPYRSPWRYQVRKGFASDFE
jgi:uncharacterized protein (TIGR02687 family)